MQALFQLIDNVRQLNGKRILFVVTDSKDFFDVVEQYNLQDQLFDKGINSKGETIGFYAGTNETFTLHDTGQFYESFDLFVTENEVIFEAEREFEDGSDIFFKYGIDIIGLTDENFEKVTDYIKLHITPIILQEVFKNV